MKDHYPSLTRHCRPGLVLRHEREWHGGYVNLDTNHDPEWIGSTGSF